jgi:hypothetical protein
VSEQVNNRSKRFPSGAWLALAAAAILLLGSVGKTIYRYTLATDGWSETMQPEQVPVWLQGAAGTRAAEH